MTPAQVPELPNEILLLIIQCCPRATLKNARLATKTLAQMAEPYLWREVVLVPNQTCILSFVKALKHSKITRHVTKLVYDARFGQFCKQIKTYPPDPGVEWPQEDRARVEALLEQASRGRFQPHEDMALEVAILPRALRILPNLREVRVRDYDEPAGATITKVPYFYLKLCRLARVDLTRLDFSRMSAPGTRSYTKGILTAIFSAGCRIQSFKAKNVDARALFGAAPVKTSAAIQQLLLFQTVMDSIRVLELFFRDTTLTPAAYHLEYIHHLLKTAKKLKSLTLRLTNYTLSHYQYLTTDDDIPPEWGIILESSTGTWMSRPLLPRLEHLNIDACTCHSEDLLHFLKIHADTLRRLEMSNITLMGVEDRRECWVKLIKNLKIHLRLTHVSFSGWLTNGGRQHWFVAKDNVGEGRLKAKVEKYIADKSVRVCPLEPLAIHADGCDVGQPANGEEWEGDLTWTMIYASRIGGYPFDWQLTTPIFGSIDLEEMAPSSTTGDSESLLSAMSDVDPAGCQDFENDTSLTIEDESHLMTLDTYIPPKAKKKTKIKGKAKATSEHWANESVSKSVADSLWPPPLNSTSQAQTTHPWT